MSSLLAITRTVMIGFIWSFLFCMGMQEVMVHYWRFNPIRPDHWVFIWNLWIDGWVVDEASEIFFFITLFSIVPVWLTGWTASCLIPWWAVIFGIISFPFRFIKRKMLSKKNQKKPALQKKLSYKKTRPPAVRTKIKKPNAENVEQNTSSGNEENKPTPTQMSPKPSSSPSSPSSRSESGKGATVSKPKSSKKASSVDAVEEIIEKAGYEVITDATIGDHEINFVAIAEEKIILCLVDSEEGDWLADEERFNDEEPLWFSESSHRVSPVRKVLDAKASLVDALSETGESIEVEVMVIVSNGTIINAEDMFEIWEDLDVMIGRVGDGGPEEIQILEDALPNNDSGEATEDVIENIRKAISFAK